MIDRKKLEQLIDRYDAKAERNFLNYQDTGFTRYEREQHNAEDMAEALRAALNAAEEHETLQSLKVQVLDWASKSEYNLDTLQDTAIESLLRDIVSFAAMVLHYRRMEWKRSGSDETY